MAIVICLDRVMAERGVSLTALSQRIGLSNVNLSRLKTGKVCAVRFSTLDRLCEALDCQPGDLLVYDASPAAQAPLAKRAPRAKPAPRTEEPPDRGDWLDLTRD